MEDSVHGKSKSAGQKKSGYGVRIFCRGSLLAIGMTHHKYDKNSSLEEGRKKRKLFILSTFKREKTVNLNDGAVVKKRNFLQSLHLCFHYLSPNASSSKYSEICWPWHEGKRVNEFCFRLECVNTDLCSGKKILLNVH